MRLRTVTFVLVAVALIGSACITEQRAILFVSIDPPPPATVEESEFDVAGLVVRSPPDPLAIFTVTAITTSPSGVDTAVVQSGTAGNFIIRIPIARDTLGVLNQVLIIATDDTPDAISAEAAFSINGLRTGPALRGQDE